MLSVLDSFAEQNLGLEVDTSFSSRRVTRALDKAIDTRGKREAIRWDNGLELTSSHLLTEAIENKTTSCISGRASLWRTPLWKASMEGYATTASIQGSGTCSTHGTRSRYGNVLITKSASLGDHIPNTERVCRAGGGGSFLKE